MADRCRYDEHLTGICVSDGALALTGRPAAVFIAGRVHFRDFVHPENLERVRAATLTAFEGHRDFEVEYRVNLPGGGAKWVLSRGAGVDDPAGKLVAFAGLALDITARKNAEHERIALGRKLLEGQKFESLGLLAGGIAHDCNHLLTAMLGNATLARLVRPPRQSPPRPHRGRRPPRRRSLPPDTRPRRQARPRRLPPHLSPPPRAPDGQ